MGNTNNRDQGDHSQSRKDSGSQVRQGDTSTRQQASGKTDTGMGKSAGSQDQQASGKQGSGQQDRHDSNR